MLPATAAELPQENVSVLDAEVAAMAEHIGMGPADPDQPAFPGAPTQAPSEIPGAAPSQPGAPAASVLPFTVPDLKPQPRPWHQLEEPSSAALTAQLAELKNAVAAIYHSNQQHEAPPEYDIDPEVGKRLDGLEHRIAGLVQPLLEEQEFRRQREEFARSQQAEVEAARADLQAFLQAGNAYAQQAPEYPAIREAAVKANVETMMMAGHSQQEAQEFAVNALRGVYRMAQDRGLDPAQFHHRLIAAQAGALHSAVAAKPAVPAQPQRTPTQSLPHPAAAAIPGGGSAAPTFESALRAAAQSGSDSALERVVSDPRWGGTLSQRLAQATTIMTGLARQQHHRR